MRRSSPEGLDGSQRISPSDKDSYSEVSTNQGPLMYGPQYQDPFQKEPKRGPQRTPASGVSVDICKLLKGLEFGEESALRAGTAC